MYVLIMGTYRRFAYCFYFRFGTSLRLRSSKCVAKFLSLKNTVSLGCADFLKFSLQFTENLFLRNPFFQENSCMKVLRLGYFSLLSVKLMNLSFNYSYNSGENSIYG